MRACLVASGVSDSLRLYGLQPARLLCPWDSPGKNTGVGRRALLRGIFPTQGSNFNLSPALAGRFFTTSSPAAVAATYIWGKTPLVILISSRYTMV